MKLSTVLLVFGLCLGTLGAAGFNQLTGTTEPGSVLYLALGVALLVVGGALERGARHAGRSADGQGGSMAWFGQSIEGIKSQIIALDEERHSLAPREIHARIDELLSGDYFDLTSHHEQLVSLVGFGDYARVWDGVASAERLLSRAWSMITDGHDEEGLAELPLARQQIEQASRVLATLL